MAELGCPFRGVLFVGLMITARGPQLIEYNVRFGDPECQVLMLRLKDDLLPLLNGAVDGQAVAHDRALARRGRADRGDGGHGLSQNAAKAAARFRVWDEASAAGVEIFHAGTAQKKGTGKLVAAGGRVLKRHGAGPDRHRGARTGAYEAVDRHRLGRKASAAAISGGGRWRGRNPADRLRRLSRDRLSRRRTQKASP